GAFARGADLPRLDGLVPREPALGERDPGLRVGLHHRPRRAPGVPAALDRLDGSERRDPDLDGVAGCFLREQGEVVLGECLLLGAIHQASAAGRVADQAWRSSSSGISNWPSTTRLRPAVTPSGVAGTPWSA